MELYRQQCGMEWSRRAPQTAPHKIVFVRHKKQANCSFSFGPTKCPRKWFRNKCSQSPPRSYSNLRRSILILYSKYKQNMFSARNVYVICSCSQLLFKQSAVEKKTESRWEIVINFNMKHENSESQLVFACIECCDLGKGVWKMVQSDKNEWRKQHEGVLQLQLFECSYPKIPCTFTKGKLVSYRIKTSNIILAQSNNI